MALKEQANKHKNPRNRNSNYRDGKPLEKHILREQKPIINDKE